MMKTLVLTAALVTAGLVARADEAFRLSENGRPQAEIVLGEQASWAAKWGAVELRHFLKAVTGGDFRIVTEKGRTNGVKPIFVGASEGAAKLGADAAKLGPQQHDIVVTKDAMALVGVDEKPDPKEPALPKMQYADGHNAHEGGNSPLPNIWTKHGTMDAVYGFLQDSCGVAFLDPTDDGTTVESRPTLDIPVGARKVEPWVACRDMGSYYPYRWGQKDTGFAAYKREAYPFANLPGRFTPAMINSQDRLFFLRARLGGERALANHSFGYWYDRFLDTNSVRFVSFHPEYFGQKTEVPKGARYIEAIQFRGNSPLQLCYTNPGVIRQAIEDARDYFDKGGWPVYDRDGRIVRYDPVWGVDVFCLEPMDNAGFCNCPRCRAEYPKEMESDMWRGRNHADYWFRFVNKVATEVKKTHPTKRISTLAYMSHTAPPSFRMEDNVEVHFCHHGNRMPHATDMNAVLESHLKGWFDKLAPGHLGVWFYNGFPYRHLGFPGFFLHLHAKQYREWIHDLQIRRTVFHCGCHDHLENYAISRWMWDPLYDVEKLRDTYLRSYGPAEPKIRAIVDLMEDRYCNLKYCPQNEGHQSLKHAWTDQCPQEVQERIEQLMAEALATPGLEGPALRRTRVFKNMYVDYIDTGATFMETLPQTKPGVSLTRRRYLETHARLPKPIPGDLIGVAPEFTIASFDEDAAKVKPIKKTTALNDKRNGTFCVDLYGVTNVLYACDRKVPALRRLRVTIHCGDCMRAKALLTPVGRKDGKWIRLADEVGRDNVPGGKTTLDFEFEKGAVPADLEAIGIVESGKRERFNGPRIDAIEVVLWEGEKCK